MNARNETAINPVIINPLIAYENDPEETAENVRNALTFLSMAFRGGVDIAGNRNAMDGVGLILDSCATALSFHINKKDGAA